MRANRAFWLTLAGLGAVAIGCAGIAALEKRRLEALRRDAARLTANGQIPGSSIQRLEAERAGFRAEIDVCRADAADASTVEEAIERKIGELLARGADGRAESMFALELCAVGFDPIPLRFIGVSGGDRGSVALFESIPGRKLFPARSGGRIGNSGYVLVDVAAKPAGRAVANIRREGSGRVVEMASGRIVPDSLPTGLFAAPDGAVRLRKGESLERDGVRYRVVELRDGPPVAEIEWDLGDGTATRRRKVTIEAESQ